MKRFFPLVVLLISALAISSCGQKKSENTGDGVVLYDTIPVTNIQIAPEYFFAGDFTYMADAAVLKETATGRNIPVAMVEKYPDAEKQYLGMGVEAGKPVYAEFRGFIKPKGADEEGPDKQLAISQVLKMEKAGKPSYGMLIGSYSTADLVLKVNSDHTYSLLSKGGETEAGKWYLYDEDIIVFNAGNGHTIMDIRSSGNKLKTRDDIPVTFERDK